MSGFVKGFTAFFMASHFLYQNRMHKWYLLPVMLWLALFLGVAISVADVVEDSLLYWLAETWGVEFVASEAQSGWLASLKALLSLSVAFVIKMLVWLLVGRMTKYLILIIMAPLMAYLSEKAESLVNKREYRFSLQQTVIDAARGALVSLRNLAMEMLLLLLTFLVSLVLPILAVPAMLFMFVVSSYFIGFNMFYYLLERQQLDMAQTLEQARLYRSHVLGLGLACNLVSLLPLLDWVIAPINGPVAAVLAARNTRLLPGQADA